jgi:hypothetical protein
MTSRVQAIAPAIAATRKAAIENHGRDIIDLPRFETYRMLNLEFGMMSVAVPRFTPYFLLLTSYF